jgi:PhnB protein
MSRVDQFIPHLCVSNGIEALEYYKSVFGGVEQDRIMSPDGRKLAHGEIVIDGHMCFLSDEFPEDASILRWNLRADHAFRR